MIRLLVAALFAGLIAVSGCAAAVTCGCITPITVFGAASLTNALAEMKTGFTSAYPVAVLIEVSTGSSTALRTQIEQGAPAAVFLSADTSNAQALADAGLVDGAVVSFATNHLAIIVPKGNPGHISSALDLGRANVRVIAAGPDVPITKYAGQAIAKLGALPGYPADFAAAYESNIRSREDNVGAVTAKIALGEGDAAIVYVTDAKAADVDVIPIPAEADVTATYAGAVLKSTAGPKAAHALLDWIRGASGQQILAKYGFSPAP